MTGMGADSGRGFYPPAGAVVSGRVGPQMAYAFRRWHEYWNDPARLRFQESLDRLIDTMTEVINDRDYR